MTIFGIAGQHPGVKNPRSTRRYITRAATLALGALFLLAGISKLFVVGAFAETVASVTLLPREASRIAASAIVAFEILGALILLSGRRTRLIAVVFAFLVGAFITVLTLAVLQGREITCNCFGILGIRLSNLHEIILDLTLFNGFLGLAILGGKRSLRSSSPSKSGRAAGWALCVAGGLLLEFLLMFPIVRRALGPGARDYESVISFAKRADTLFAQHNGENRILLLLNYSDFSCPICFDDFAALTDSLKSRYGDGQQHNVVALFRESPQSSFNSPDRLEHWIAANGILFPVFLTPVDTFQTVQFVKSMVVVLDPADRILFSEIFPMGDAKRSVALRLLETLDANLVR